MDGEHELTLSFSTVLFSDEKDSTWMVLTVSNTIFMT